MNIFWIFGFWNKCEESMVNWVREDTYIKLGEN